MTVLVGNHDFLTGCKLNGDSVLNAEFCLEYVEISTNGVNLKSMKPDFDLTYLFTNPAGLAFCTMTPVYLGILTLYYPRVNIATLRVTSLLGVIIGFWNMVMNFIIEPDVLWWNGVLHLPLVFVSIYALVLSFRKTTLSP